MSCRKMATSTPGKTAIVWYKYSDLRIRDHEPLSVAHSEYDRVVHVFVFDPFWHGRTELGGFPKCGHFRARFLLDSLVDLRKVSIPTLSVMVCIAGAERDRSDEKPNLPPLSLYFLN